MPLTPDQINDLVTLTLPKFERNKWTDLSMEFQEYVSSTLIDAKKVVEAGGELIKFQIKTKNTGNARNTGMFAPDITKVEDVVITASVPWAMQTTNFSYDVDEELFQSDRETIIRELLIRDHDAMSDMAELNEINLWTSPTDTSDARPLGIPYWMQKSATAGDGGFVGGNPAGHPAGCAGVDSTKYPRWRNWAFSYINVSPEDLVKKVKKALAYTNFKAPVPHPELGFGKSDYNLYTIYDIRDRLERLAESRNDNLGADVAKYIGEVTIGGVPVKWVPYLDANDTSGVLYGVNWKTFRPFVKRGANMRRSKPKEAANQHNVRTVFIDNWMNYICYNRRLNFVGCLAA